MRKLFRKRETAALIALRGRELLSALDLVLERRRWTREQVRAFQTRSLKKLVAYAYERVPLYRAKYDAAGFSPAQISGVEDLAQIPVLTKDELRRAALADLKCPAYVAPARLLASSGSTGMPSRLFRDEDSLTYFAAQDMALYFDWCEGRPIASSLYFIDLAPDTIDYALADLLRTTVPEERILDAASSTARLIVALRRFAPEFVSSYPSTLRNIAVALDRRGETYERLRLLHLTSEMLDAPTRALLERVFPCAGSSKLTHRPRSVCSPRSAGPAVGT